MSKTLKSKLVPLALAGLLITTVSCAHNYGNIPNNYPTSEQKSQTQNYPEKQEIEKSQNTSNYDSTVNLLINIAFSIFRLYH